MSTLKFVLSLAAVALLLAPAARAADKCSDLRPGINRITVKSANLRQGPGQSMDLVMPESFSPDARVPLVIGLHPSGGSGAKFNRDTELGRVASTKGFATIFPDGGVELPADGGGTGHYWNVPGVPLVGGGEVPGNARDDVRFIADIIDHVVKNNCIDARRIFVTGFSGGARMSSAIGCRLADRVAAVAPVAGLRAGRATASELSEPDPSDCRPSRPVAVLAIHGTDDGTNPFRGGEGIRWGYSVERAAERWASLDHCNASPVSAKVSAHVTRVRYGTCASDSDVSLYRIDAPSDQGGGHVWPGGRGDRNAELDATQLVLEFFGKRSAESPDGQER